MTNYKKFNIIGGWVTFAIAAFTYISTMEPTASLWDCGEFIATSYRLEVGHPPGAPLFMMLGKVFSLFAGGDVTKVAMMLNLMSALASAFTILFLFWSISYIAKKIILSVSKTDELNNGQLVAVLGSAFVGALAYAFSDTNWFSAVEAEVYALSSLFTAVVFWAILKWDEQADEPHANRWIILIAYLMGLSIGVHLLNLLVIPAIALIYYFRKYSKPTVLGGILTFGISFVILLVVMYGIVQGLISIGSGFELLFVNSFGLPFNSGFIFYLVLLTAATIGLLFWSRKKQKVVLHTALLSFLVIVIGYFSFAMIVIRSAANPPIDENDPENTFALKSYLNREQYGDRPLISGQFYDAEAIDQKYEYTYVSHGDKYVKVKKVNPVIKYDPKRSTIFPRMYSSSSDHIEAYESWGNVKNGKPSFANNLKFFFEYQVGFMYLRYFGWNFIGRQNDIQSHGSALNGNVISGIPFLDELVAPQKDMPDRLKNMKSRNTYFLLPLILGIIGLLYQVKHKQSFWATMTFFIMTGFAIVVYLNQTPYQPRERDYAYVGSFYAFSIWIGLSVLSLYELLKKYLKKDMLSAVAPSVLLLFIPILMGVQNWDDHDRSNRYHTVDFASNYLNSCAKNGIIFTYGDNDTFPLWYAQEVEGIRTDVRDVNLSLFSTDWYANQMKRKAYESAPIPLNVDPEKYAMGVRDVIFVYDNPRALFKEKYNANKSTLEPKYIQLYNITMSELDKSNFPSKFANDYNQLKKGYGNLDVELFVGFVMNLPANADKIGMNKVIADSLKLKATNLFNEIAGSYAPIDAVMDFALSDDKTNMLMYGDEYVNYIPTTKILIPVDKQKIKDLGFVPENKMNLVGEDIRFTLSRKYLLKANWFVLKMIADNKWERPIYFATGIGEENYMGLQQYFRLEGFAYRLIPYKAQNIDGETGEINTDILYENVMKTFKWGNINSDDFYVDHYVDRQVSVMKIRNLFHRLAFALIKEDKKDKALEVLDKCLEILPDSKIEFDYDMIPIIEDYYLLEKFDKGNEIANIIVDNSMKQLTYFEHFSGKKAALIERDQQIALYMLQNIYVITSQYKQTDIATKIEPVLQANLDKMQMFQ